MLISSMLFIPMSDANIVPSVEIPGQPMRVAESVGVDLAERLRIAVGGELVDRRNRVVAEPFRPSGHRRAARVDAQDRADHRVEPLRLARVVRIRSAAVAEPEVAAAGVEQAVVGRAGLRRRVELDVAERMRQVRDDVRRRGAARACVPSNVFAAGFVACHSVMTLW